MKQILRLWKFVLLWVIAVVFAVIGFRLLVAAGLRDWVFIGLGIPPINTAMLVRLMLFRFLQGSLIGTSQWLVIRPRIDRAEWWIVTTALGYSFGALYVDLATYSRGYINMASVSPLIASGLQGIGTWVFVAIGQWIVIRNQVERAFIWILMIPLVEFVGLIVYWQVNITLGIFMVPVMSLSLIHI